jgi:hypothetical protein
MQISEINGTCRPVRRGQFFTYRNQARRIRPSSGRSIPFACHMPSISDFTRPSAVRRSAADRVEGAGLALARQVRRLRTLLVPQATISKLRWRLRRGVRNTQPVLSRDSFFQNGLCVTCPGRSRSASIIAAAQVSPINAPLFRGRGTRRVLAMTPDDYVVTVRVPSGYSAAGALGAGQAVSPAKVRRRRVNQPSAFPAYAFKAVIACSSN